MKTNKTANRILVAVKLTVIVALLAGSVASCLCGNVLLGVALTSSMVMVMSW